MSNTALYPLAPDFGDVRLSRPMSVVETLAAGLPTLFDNLIADLPEDLLLRGLGVVLPQDRDRALLAYYDAFGSAVYLPAAKDLPEAFRPRSSEQVRINAADLLKNPAGLVESRLMHPMYAKEV